MAFLRRTIQFSLMNLLLLNFQFGRLMWTAHRDLPTTALFLSKESFLRANIGNRTDTASAAPEHNAHHPIRVKVRCGRGGQQCGDDFSMPTKIHDGPTMRQQLGLPKRILFHHIHKCGGTSVCTMAKMNGEVTFPRPDRKDPVCFILPPNNCLTRVQDFVPADSNITFLEYPCGRKEDADWPVLNNGTNTWQLVTFLRHPLERLLSEYRHFGYLSRTTSTTSSNFSTQEEQRNNLDAFADYASTHTNELLNWIAPGWKRIQKLTNQTSGGNATQVDDAILDFAKQRLQEYDVLVVLEDMAVDCPRFAQAMGWNVTVACSVHRNADATRSTNAATLLGKERTNTILELNTLDMRLYEYARQLAVKQRMTWSKRQLPS